MVIIRHVLMLGEASRKQFISRTISLWKCPAAVSFISNNNDNNYTGSELTAFITLTTGLLEESVLQLVCVCVCGGWVVDKPTTAHSAVKSSIYKLQLLSLIH